MEEKNKKEKESRRKIRLALALIVGPLAILTIFGVRMTQREISIADAIIETSYNTATENAATEESSTTGEPVTESSMAETESFTTEAKPFTEETEPSTAETEPLTTESYIASELCTTPTSPVLEQEQVNEVNEDIVPLKQRSIAWSEDNNFAIDYTEADRGLIQAKGLGVIAVYVYDSSNTLVYKAVFPIETESFVPVSIVCSEGNYTVKLYKQADTNSTKFLAAVSAPIEVKEPSDFCSPTYCVNYDSELEQLANRITEGQTSVSDKVNAFKSYVSSTLEYDYAFAEAVKSGAVKYYTPNLSEIIARKKGVCYDYAALFAALCRSQGIPCKLIKGTVPLGSHAWNEVMVEGKWMFVDCLAIDGKADGYAKKSEY